MNDTSDFQIDSAAHDRLRPRLGVWRAPGGRLHCRVYAPQAQALDWVLDGQPAAVALQRDDLGYWTGAAPDLPAGTIYWFEVDGQRCSDPASRRQPLGVHGPSAVVDLRRAATPGWTGVPIEDAVLYELHLGTFTPEGTLAAAQARLPHLQALGVNVVELLPLAAFPGERNWGYDGTHLLALHTGYGTHDDLRAFIEAAHDRGLAVILDVVHNHFGPEGHYAERLAPYTKAAATPWGAAVNVDGAHNHGIRAFFLESIRHWIGDVGFDGLRMDATAWIFDSMPVHILRECVSVARAIGEAQGRQVLMIAEDLRNNRYVTDANGHGFDAQWNDDPAHALYACVTGEQGGHCRDFGRFDDVLLALRDGFVYDGTRFSHRVQFLMGTDGRDMPGRAHVVYVQNHDQVGNRPYGDRLYATYGRARYQLALTAVMAAPFVPMLFMGDEYGETAPFQFFEDFGDPVLVAAVKVGRAADYDFGTALPPDPHDRATFEASRLDWSRAESPEGREMLAWTAALIALKRSGELGPRERRSVRFSADIERRLLVIDAPRTRTLLNFSDSAQDVSAWSAGRSLRLGTMPGMRRELLPACGAVVLSQAEPG